MSITELQSLRPGTPVTLFCCTTDKHIYVKKATDDGRYPIRPTESQLMSIPYLQSGTVKGTLPGEYPCLILEAIGEAADIDYVRNTPKVVGVKRKLKEVRVPVSAIKRYKVDLC